jgi:hypothetical protein
MFLTLRSHRTAGDTAFRTLPGENSMLNAGWAAQENLNPADPVVGPRAKSDHELHEKLCPLLIVVHLSAVNVVHVSFQSQGVEAQCMLQPEISACYVAGSTYGTLTASKPEGETSFPGSGDRRVFDVAVNPLSTPSRSSESHCAAFCLEPPSVFCTSSCLGSH